MESLLLKNPLDKLSFSLRKEIENSVGRKIMFWGASLFLKDFLSKQALFSNVAGIIDRDSAKWNRDFCGYKIYSPQMLDSINPDRVILTIINDNEAVYESLREEFLQKYPAIELCENITAAIKYYCPFCKKEAVFKNAGYPLRYSARCPYCNSLERHRFLYYIYEQILEENKNRKIKILHTAPEECVYKYLSRKTNIEYTTVDLNPDGYPYADNCLKMNILDMKFEDNTFDYILSNHVIEHIEDEAGFFRECLRVLKPDGKLIITAPYFKELETTFEDPAIVTDEERLKYYGQSDHVRKYGRDIFARFSKYGKVSVLGADFLPENLREKMNLGDIESAAIISKILE